MLKENDERLKFLKDKNITLPPSPDMPYDEPIAIMQMQNKLSNLLNMPLDTIENSTKKE